MMKLNRKLFLCSLNRPEAKKAGSAQFGVKKLKPKAQWRNFNLRKIFFLSLCLTLCIGSFQSIRSSPLHSAHLTVNNLKRTFLFYVPKHVVRSPEVGIRSSWLRDGSKGNASVDGRTI